MLTIADTLADYRVDARATGGDLAATLAQHGFAIFDGVTDARALPRLAHCLGAIVRHRHSDGSGVTGITNRHRPVSRIGQAGFTDQALAPHTDCSGQPDPPHLVLMACARPALRGGECIVVDGQAVHAELAATAPEALIDLSSPRCALFGALFGGAAGFLGTVFERQPDGRIALRLRSDKLARFSPRTQRWLPTLHQAIERHALTFELPTGTGYAVNNRRWLHGRRAFTGQRVMWRVLVNPHAHWDIPTGFEPVGGAR
jgi:alpha-ketoglutarate-dependent taurine dioxygenase